MAEGIQRHSGNPQLHLPELKGIPMYWVTLVCSARGNLWTVLMMTANDACPPDTVDVHGVVPSSNSAQTQQTHTGWIWLCLFVCGLAAVTACYYSGWILSLCNKPWKGDFQVNRSEEQSWMFCLAGLLETGPLYSNQTAPNVLETPAWEAERKTQQLLQSHNVRDIISVPSAQGGVYLSP